MANVKLKVGHRKPHCANSYIQRIGVAALALRKRFQFEKRWQSHSIVTHKSVYQLEFTILNLIIGLQKSIWKDQSIVVVDYKTMFLLIDETTT